jgi:hypothetical protein
LQSKVKDFVAKMHVESGNATTFIQDGAYSILPILKLMLVGEHHD